LICASWINELVSSCKRDGKPFRHVHQFITTMRTSPKVLLRIVRLRWVIENEWHWVHDGQLGGDVHRSAEHHSACNGIQILALLRTTSLNLVRINGFCSITAE
jgi:predicted transposase YbfD/YdcC